MIFLHGIYNGMKKSAANIFYTGNVKWILLAILVLVFFARFWVCDDAYITFRSIENFIAGEGMRWNPHERVQSFTHPLWFFVLSFFRLFISDIYIVALSASIVCFAGLLFIIRKIFPKDAEFGWVLFLLIACLRFIDYLGSGLENTLSFVLIAMFFLKFFSGERNSRHLLAIYFILSLAMLNRMDLMLILAPAALLRTYELRNEIKLIRIIKLGISGFSPFIIWSLFSIAYYGFLFPNTAYAKLNLGLSHIELLERGWDYYQRSLADPIMLTVILTMVCLTFISKKREFIAPAVGIILYLFYIAWIGGDFMLNRFLTAPYLASIIILVKNPSGISFGNQKKTFACVAVIVLSLVGSASFRADADINYDGNNMGIANERMFYKDQTNLAAFRKYKKHRQSVFPNAKWSHVGKNLENVSIQRDIGFMGYNAATDKIIIDRLALTDPFLARLPVISSDQRIGHFIRIIPTGYIDSVRSGENMIENKNLAEYYDKIKIITQNPVFGSAERWKTIFLMNIGKYNYLLKGIKSW